MPAEAQQLADFRYDLARDIVRVWTATGSLLLPLCFFWHGLRVTAKEIPDFLKDLQKESLRTVTKIFRERWWLIVFPLGAWVALDHVYTIEPEEGYPELFSSLLSISSGLLYPIFSFSFIWQLRNRLAPSLNDKVKVADQSMLVALLWIVFALYGAKSIATFMGLLAMVYTLFAVRGDLSLALIVNRGMNPISAFLTSYKYSRGRAVQFAWTFSLLSGVAWVIYVQTGAVRSGIYVSELLNNQIEPTLQSFIEGLVFALSTLCLSFIDSLIFLRGVCYLKYLEAEP